MSRLLRRGSRAVLNATVPSTWAEGQRVARTQGKCQRCTALDGRSGLPHVGGDLRREEILAGRREHVDHLGVLGKPRLVLQTAGDQAEIPRTTNPLVPAEAELHP